MKLCVYMCVQLERETLEEKPLMLPTDSPVSALTLVASVRSLSNKTFGMIMFFYINFKFLIFRRERTAEKMAYI